LTFVVLPAQAQPPTHVVQPGETLYRIATNYGVTVIRAFLALQMIAQLSNGAIHGLLGFDKRRSRLG
jgi:hypothetical protein